MTTIWTYLVIHWGFIVSGATMAGLVLGYFVGIWKSKSEIDLAKSQKAKVDFELEQAKLDIETKSIAQVVMILTDSHKQKAGTQNMAFSFDDLYEDMGSKYCLRLHAAINLLVAQGRAKRDTVNPGYWYFN